MDVQIRYQNGTLTVSLGGRSTNNGNSGDSTCSKSSGTTGPCSGGLVLGPIVVPLGSQSQALGGDAGDSRVDGGDAGDSRVDGGDAGDSRVDGGDEGSGGTTNGSGGGYCSATVIGPIVFTGCSNAPSLESSSKPSLRPVNIAPLLISPSKPNTATPANKATFVMEIQKEAQWCWAAVTVSVNNFLDTPASWTQTALASTVLNTVCSAVPNANDPCDRQYSLDGPLSVTGNLFKPGGAKFDQYVKFADLQKYWAIYPYPVCVRIVWNDGSGNAHFIALTGYTHLSGGQQLVTVHDPSPTAFGPAVWDYDLLRVSYESPSDTLDPEANMPRGHWNDTYFVQP